MTCLVCKKEFETKKKTQKYCSLFCEYGDWYIINRKIFHAEYKKAPIPQGYIIKIDKNREFSPEWRKKLSEAKLKNHPRYWLGKHRYEETKEKLRQYTGDKTSNWQGGIGNLPYSFDFNEKLKIQIKERDNYTCQMCGKQDFTKNGVLHIHHIDYDKLNSNLNNLITLCNSCHSLTGRNREFYSFVLKPLAFGLIGEVCI